MTIFKDIGNFFVKTGGAIGRGIGSAGKAIGNQTKIGWNNGNLIKGLAVAGQVAMTTGLIGSVFTDKSRECCHHRRSCGFTGRYENPYYILNQNPYLQNPYQQNWSQANPYLQNPYQQNWSQANPYLQNPYQQNWSQANPYLQNLYQQNLMQQNSLQEIGKNNVDAGKVDASQDKTAGQTFQSEIDKMGDDTSVNVKMFDTPSSDAEYKTKVSELAKSYIASIDSDGDGYVSKSELLKLFDAPGIRDAAYNLINLNGNDKIDWKELASLLAAMDTTSQKDGTISNNEAKSFLEKLATAVNTDEQIEIKRTIQQRYTNLFGQ